MSDRGSRMNLGGEEEEQVPQGSWVRALWQSLACRCCRALWCLGQPEPQVGLGQPEPRIDVNPRIALSAKVLEPAQPVIVAEPVTAGGFIPQPVPVVFIEEPVAGVAVAEEPIDEVQPGVPEEDLGQGDAKNQEEKDEEVKDMSDSDDDTCIQAARVSGYATDGGVLMRGSGNRNLSRGYHTSME